MSTTSPRHGCLRAAASAILSLLMVGVAGAPAHATSIREQQWFLDAMKADQMWQISTGKGITVAVIDTGVDPDNPDLRGRVLDGKDFAPSSRAGDEHTDYDGHGTGMAGLIAGTGALEGGNGAFGLAPSADILPVRMPDADDVSPFEVSAYFSKGIRYAVDSKAQIINVSMSGGISSPELIETVRYAVDKGSLVFASMGNDAETTRSVNPLAATPGVVAVGAVGRDLRRAPMSQYGPEVDISAPGVDMVHACGGKTGLCKTSGTSDATAIASASAALIWSKHPNWTNNQVLRVMLNTIGAPTDGAKRNDSIGYGIVRPRIALQKPGDPGPADKYPLPDLEAAVASASPSPEPSATDAADRPARDGNTEKAAGKSEDGTLVWVVLGAAAVAVLGGAMGALTITRRRRVQQEAGNPPAPHHTPGGQPPYAAPQHPAPPYRPPHSQSSSVPPPQGPGHG
ncbi:type VII secretion-associated serine protease mycosin [Streptomyces neyagawaensis]|uniref:type VII secretion-associated serine protease mycosin n=1 Tax=Streptomyces neyagawaensis TaxID=42238 RepID=UPI00099EEBD7|nr:type VII secretion-associated serine protease mycosin [Streptomyces neyagawaensis]MCL6733002.1 type VII secretion-associated serine protease mycosin [Streptomyces neyagawaensis]MDE1684863.1 type VII secretion-associated serine protease mycosin [Streptomyces neyagawaensis]